MVWPGRSGKRVRDGLLIILGVGALLLAALFALYEPREHAVRLRMTAGQERGTRHRIAQVLRREAAHRTLAIELQATAGSEEALQAMESGRVDAAFLQGGLDMGDHPALRQVAALHVEPLHLLVTEAIQGAVVHNLAGLRGKVVNLGERGSGTNLLAKEVMAFSGLRAGIDYTESTHRYADLVRETEGSRLPDAVFSVSTLPSPIARHLVTKHNFRLVPLPFWEAFALGTLDEDPSPPPAHSRLRPGSIGGISTTRRSRRSFTTSTPGYPQRRSTPSAPGCCWLPAGTFRKPPSDASSRWCSIPRSPGFSSLPLDGRLLESPPELPLHDGTNEYLRRNAPLIAGDVIDQVEKQVSILGVVAGGLFCLSQWLRRRYRWRRERSFEAYILQVAQVERRALTLSRAPTLDLAALLQLQDDLTQIKGEALQRFADGELHGEELMSGFLAHTSDARDFLVRLILHERENLEDRALAQRRPAEALWKEAVGELTSPAADTRVFDSQDVVAVPKPTGSPIN